MLRHVKAIEREASVLLLSLLSIKYIRFLATLAMLCYLTNAFRNMLVNLRQSNLFPTELRVIAQTRQKVPKYQRKSL